MIEPRLDDLDRRVWNSWWSTALLHSKSLGYRSKVDNTKRLIEGCLREYPNSVVMWSAGKDSTVLSHLVAVGLGAPVPLISEKDDLDYPGEEEYITSLSEAWGANLKIVRPDKSPAQWIKEHASQLSSAQDFHSRAAGLSKECFYGVVEASCAKKDLIFLGLRSEESRGRKMNRATRGLVYRKAPSEWNPKGVMVAQPLGDWTGLDVYAYLAECGIDPLPVYRCVGLMHSKEPWRVRKSWWIPGAHSRQGGTAWLRRYWPTLYRKLQSWMPDASFYT